MNAAHQALRPRLRRTAKWAGTLMAVLIGIVYASTCIYAAEWGGLGPRAGPGMGWPPPHELICWRVDLVGGAISADRYSTGDMVSGNFSFPSVVDGLRIRRAALAGWSWLPRWYMTRPPSVGYRTSFLVPL